MTWSRCAHTTPPFFFVAKKDSDVLQLCQDYHYLNDGTIKNVYPLPLVGDLLNKLKGAQWFTKLDIWWGYHNIRIKDGDQWKGAVKTNRGVIWTNSHVFWTMQFPGTISGHDEWYFQGYDRWRMYSDLHGQHPYILQRSHGASGEDEMGPPTLSRTWPLPKSGKYWFDMHEVEFLGMIIKLNQLTMDLTKLAGIKDWLMPTKCQSGPLILRIW
jgi:hypothetical protein